MGEAYLVQSFTPPILFEFSATGASSSTDGADTIHSFTSNGSFTVAGNGLVDVLVVGGGGSGGAGTGGGGGAGGLIYIQGWQLSAGTYNVTIGQGGTNDDYLTGTSGENTVISGPLTLTALGGGFGGSTESGGPNANAANGGSGGGGQNYYSGNNGVGSGLQNSTTNDGVNNYSNTGFGNDGGPITSGTQSSGGGGADSIGDNNVNNFGGRAKYIDITGTSLPYAEGGTGGSGAATGNRDGIGGTHTGTNGTNGAANTGSGGGGGWSHSSGIGGNGGSGIVIIRVGG